MVVGAMDMAYLPPDNRINGTGNNFQGDLWQAPSVTGEPRRWLSGP
jgi:hypothetical protein